MNEATMNICLEVLVWYLGLLGRAPRSEIPGLYENYMLKCIRSA